MLLFLVIAPSPSLAHSRNNSTSHSLVPVYPNSAPCKSLTPNNLFTPIFRIKDKSLQINSLHTLPENTGVYPLKAKLRRNLTDPSSGAGPTSPEQSNSCRHLT